MKVVELVGRDIMKAYDGKYLSRDFGYSCANFNVRESGYGSGEENDEAMFDFYTKNTKNISCFVIYDEIGRIAGRRMFFKGKSLIDDELFGMPYKMGTQARYLYGYYGAHNNTYLRTISMAVVEKYGDKPIHTDNCLIINGRADYKTENYFIFQVGQANFAKYPPIDHLFIAPSIRALSNFNPSDEVIESLKEKNKVQDIEFFHAYRYEPGGRKSYKYSTWNDHKGTYNSSAATVQEEDDEDDVIVNPIEELKIGDEYKIKFGRDGENIYTIKDIVQDVITLSINKRTFQVQREDLTKYFEIKK